MLSAIDNLITFFWEIDQQADSVKILKNYLQLTCNYKMYTRTAGMESKRILCTYEIARAS